MSLFILCLTHLQKQQNQMENLGGIKKTAEWKSAVSGHTNRFDESVANGKSPW